MLKMNTGICENMYILVHYNETYRKFHYNKYYYNDVYYDWSSINISVCVHGRVHLYDMKLVCVWPGLASADWGGRLNQSHLPIVSKSVDN